MAGILPQAVNNYNIYVGDRGECLIGVGKVEIPELQALTSEINMAGTAGKIAVPVTGQFEAIKATIEFTMPTRQVLRTLNPNSQLITARIAGEVMDVAAGAKRIQQTTVIMRGSLTTMKLGDLEKAAAQGTSISFELDYLRVIIDDEDMLEIDKLNMIYIVDGVDYLADVRAAI